ncbi:MAG TPA: PKD domain-containing protein [Thermoplasmata archaeon]|nr:PKD domain-containing protein [Thermoplasmata archaeon]
MSSFTASPARFELGTANRSNTTLQVNLSGFVTSVLMYQYWGLPPGCTSLDQPTLPCAPSGAGQFAVEVAVTDLAGDNQTANLSLSVAPRLTASPSASPPNPDAGQLVQFVPSVQGGIGPYGFGWEFGDGTGSTSVSPVHSYSSAAAYVAKLWVNDSGGGEYTGSLPVSAGSGPAVVLVALDPRPPVGATLQLRANVTGGRAPLSYSYSGLPPECSSANASALQCVLVEAGGFLATVEVTDSAGVRADASTHIVVGFGFTLLAPAVVTQGQGFTIQAIAAGSFGALTYAYAGLPVGCAASNGSEVNCTPEELGTSDVTVTLTDFFGDRVSHSIQIQTVGAGAAPLGTASELLLLEIAALIATAAIGLLSWSRGGRKGPPPKGRSPPPPWQGPREPPPGALGTVEVRRPP